MRFFTASILGSQELLSREESQFSYLQFIIFQKLHSLCYFCFYFFHIEINDDNFEECVVEFEVLDRQLKADFSLDLEDQSSVLALRK